MKEAKIITEIKPSPFYRLNNLSKHLNIDLWVKRDDLIPFYLGGNKVRKNIQIINDLNSNFDVLITNGAAESNHARVVALLGAQLGCVVELVLHGIKPTSKQYCGNSYFLAASNTNLNYVPSNQISEKIDQLKKHHESNGKKVLVIPGGAHSLSGAEAYAAAFNELNFTPDKIIFASGTGGTQAGLILGAHRNKANTNIIGISVAREYQRGVEEIAKLLPENISTNEIIFNDNYRFGGYEKHAPELFDLMSFVIKQEALPLDPTYTGKAMYGLFDMVKKGLIKPNEKVIFWHTGGLLNLQSTSV
ncbi:pyridoxal-phosphate dependent enzyme [Advenella sp. WQ 585]|uniref:Pyridoxal-phosphate dependent enzyme n=1 Tax=Advenella mandrilli TaxID=2800330 RepID=A0ABS1EER8_9BURK|nr:pyridoxal-phosphate dependent enzyme [Advenella mandrilli]MBK1781738.1 pyridoxal-phosphate dependent enzyme [Advenella mandrilli]